MPIYDWRCKKTGKEVAIIRPLSESDSLPDKEEAMKAGLTEDEFNQADWEKQLGYVSMRRGNNWGAGSKGNWTLLVGIIGGIFYVFNSGIV